MHSSDKAAKEVGVDVVGEEEVEAKEETVAVLELVEDSSSVVGLLVSKLKANYVSHLLLQQSKLNSCMYSNEY